VNQKYWWVTALVLALGLAEMHVAYYGRLWALGLVLLLGMAMVGLVLRVALRRRFLAASLTAVLGLLASIGGTHSGRALRKQAIGRLLPEYRVIAESVRRAHQTSGTQVNVSSPHPTLVTASSERSPGGVVVRLGLREPPRVALYFDPLGTLPPRRDGSCLKLLEPDWYWYRTCE
jgi:hypothetical protein